jgi:hypothetical protein
MLTSRAQPGQPREKEMNHHDRDAGLGEAFAKLNGWRHSKAQLKWWHITGGPKPQYIEAGFDPYGSYPPIAADVMRIFDHCQWFSKNRRPAALVSMPYDIESKMELDDIAVRAEQIGLHLHYPPLRRSGWWNPGRTELLVFTHPDTPVHWLAMNTDADALNEARREFEEYEAAQRKYYEERKGAASVPVVK